MHRSCRWKPASPMVFLRQDLPKRKTKGRRKESDGSKNASARQPTSLRAILRPVSPRQIEATIKKAKAEVDTVVDEEIIQKLVEEAKLKIEHSKELANASPSNPAVRRKEGENHDNTKALTERKMSRSSPEQSKGAKTVVVKERRSPSKIAGEGKRKKKKISMKKSASTGITSIKVHPASEPKDYESKYDDDEGYMKTSKSSNGVFEWSRMNTERYSQGGEEAYSKQSEQKKIKHINMSLPNQMCVRCN